MTIDQGPTFHYADIRYVATGGLNALNPSWLRISMNPARGDGGTCYGDSGGPNFLGAGTGETDIVAGTTISLALFAKTAVLGIFYTTIYTLLAAFVFYGKEL